MTHLLVAFRSEVKILPVSYRVFNQNNKKKIYFLNTAISFLFMNIDDFDLVSGHMTRMPVR